MNSIRQNAMSLLEKFQAICQIEAYSSKEQALAIALASEIIKRVSPDIWYEALADANQGISQVHIPDTFV